MDDDAEDDQEFCAAAMVLAKALVEKESSFGEPSDPDKPTPLPYVELHKARQIMTRADFIQRLDRINILTIDTNATVRADSVVMQKVFHDICMTEGFDEHLEATLERLDELEGLGRTSEVAFKDLNGGGGYQATIDKDASGRKGIFVSLKPPPN